MILDDEDQEIEVRHVSRIAMGCVRREFSRWAGNVGIDTQHLTGWLQDMVNMGVAVAYAQIEKWDPKRAPNFEKWVCLKAEEQAREDLKKRTRRLYKQMDVNLALEEELKGKISVDEFRQCVDSNSLNGVLQYLSADQQEVIALYYYGCLTDIEIAQFKKMKLGTVQSLRQRALAECRKYYVLLHSPQKTDSGVVRPPARRGRKPRDNPGEEASQTQARPSKTKSDRNGEKR